MFKESYPDGYKDYLLLTIKPNGEPIFVVPLETDDTSYMIKFDVKIDTTLVDEDVDKEDYSEGDEQEGPEMVPLQEALDDEEGTHHVGALRHGALESDLDAAPKKEFEIATRDMAEEFADLTDDNEPDSYLEDDDEDDDDEDDNMEPDDDDLLDIEALLNEADNGEGLLREDTPPEEKRGRRKSVAKDPDIEAIKAVRATAKAAQRDEEKTTAKGKKATKATPAKTTAKKCVRVKKEK